MEIPDTGAIRPDLQDLRKDVAASLVWSFQALVAVAAFSAISTASHSDWELLSQSSGPAGSSITFPILNLTVGLLGFFVVAPCILIAIQVYLQIQTHTLLKLPGGREANGLIQNHVDWWPASLLGIVSFLGAPIAIASILWKVWARRFTSDAPLFFGLIHINGFTILIAALFVISFAISCWGLVSEFLFLRADTNPLSAAMLAVAMGGIVAALAVSLPERNLNLRKAPLAGADLRYFDLRSADLSEAKLTGAKMSNAMLAHAKLAGAALDDADLRGAELSRADLAGTRLDGADLSGACLVGSNFANAEIEGATFKYAWLMGAELTLLQPRTRLDRTKAPSDADIAYEKAAAIQNADFSQAKLCAAEIGVAHWSAAAAPGEPDKKFGRAYADRADSTDDRFVPSVFNAVLLSDEQGKSATDRQAFLQNQFLQCVAQIPAGEDFAKHCPEGALPP